jgi:hypothetical protein
MEWIGHKFRQTSQKSGFCMSDSIPAFSASFNINYNCTAAHEDVWLASLKSVAGDTPTRTNVDIWSVECQSTVLWCVHSLFGCSVESAWRHSVASHMSGTWIGRMNMKCHSQLSHWTIVRSAHTDSAMDRSKSIPPVFLPLFRPTHLYLLSCPPPSKSQTTASRQHDSIMQNISECQVYLKSTWHHILEETPSLSKSPVTKHGLTTNVKFNAQPLKNHL